MTNGFLFSADLVDRTVAYYERLGVFIDSETAQEYLRSMSSLYGSFIAFAEGGERSAGAGEAAPPSSDLISPHSCKEVG
jgi:hypothetical protein